MYEPLLDHARRNNTDLVKKMYREKQIRSIKPKKRGLVAWLLLKLSDLLLAAGIRIRPHEIQVYNEVKARPCKNIYMDLT
jgi:hypothetical protein